MLGRERATAESGRIFFPLNPASEASRALQQEEYAGWGPTCSLAPQRHQVVTAPGDNRFELVMTTVSGPMECSMSITCQTQGAH